jgi:hypothetical protein
MLGIRPLQVLLGGSFISLRVQVVSLQSLIRGRHKVSRIVFLEARVAGWFYERGGLPFSQAFRVLAQFVQIGFDFDVACVLLERTDSLKVRKADQRLFVTLIETLVLKPVD